MVKIARICWNILGWEKPSGQSGKSKDITSFEVNPGFGHEEWIFDFNKTIDDFKFSFLQPVNTELNTYENQEFSIYLYTIKNSVRFCIAKIDRVICLSESDAKMAYTYYQEKNWLSEMKADLDDIGISANILDVSNPLDVFNIKFKESDIHFYTPHIKIDDSLIKNSRYILQSLTPELESYLLEKTQSGNNTDIESDMSAIINNADLSDSTKLALVNARIGQGAFRKNVIELWGNGEKCAVTMIDIRELLIASHIKAWKDCESTNERLDGANGILLCSHLDKLFDRHLLTFVKKGQRYVLKLSPTLDKTQLKSIAIEDGFDLMLNSFNTDEQLRFDKYLLHHNRLFEEQSKN